MERISFLSCSVEAIMSTNCVACDPRTAKVDRDSNFGKKSASHKCSRCSLCQRQLCLRCVSRLVEGTAPDRKRIHSGCNEHLSGLDVFLESGVAPDNFVGNCCSIAEDMNKTEMSHQQHRRKKGVLSGSFCLPECRLMIGNDLKCIDVFGLGKDKKIDPTPHCVLSPSFCDEFESFSTKGPQTEVPSQWVCDEVVVEDAPAPHVLRPMKKKKRKKRRKALKIALHCVPAVSRMTPEEFEGLKGTNTPIDNSNVESFFLFQGKADVDVSIVVGFQKETPRVGSLLLCRFHTLLSETPFVSTNTVKGEVFLSMLEDALVVPVERRRRGGSSGLFTSEKFLELINQQNSSPRRGCGNVALRMKNNVTAKLCHHSCKDTTLKNVECSPAVPGGQMLMKQEIIEKHEKFLVPFFSSKILASKILLLLPTVLVESSPCHRFALMKINEDAVKCEMHCHERTLHHTDIHMQKLLKKEFHGVEGVDPMCGNFDSKKHMTVLSFIHDECRLCHYNFLSSTFINFTLVQHAVGMHVDNFADQKPSLENRLVFRIKRKHRDHGSGGCDEGRGGFDGFSFCLLDWNSKNQKKTNEWTDPKNSDNPHHRQCHPANTRLTDCIWKKFCKHQPPSNKCGSKLLTERECISKLPTACHSKSSTKCVLVRQQNSPRRNPRFIHRPANEPSH